MKEAPRKGASFYFIHLKIRNMGFIIWAIGVVLTIMAALEIWKLNVDPVKRIVVICLVVLTSWLGLAAYYLYAKNKLADWLK